MMTTPPRASETLGIHRLCPWKPQGLPGRCRGMPTLSLLKPGLARVWAPSIQCLGSLPRLGTSQIPPSQHVLPNYLPALGASHFATSVPPQPLVCPRMATALTLSVRTTMSLLRVAQGGEGHQVGVSTGTWMGTDPCAQHLMAGNTGCCCLSAMHLSPCKYRDFYINLIKELYKQS